MISLQIKQVQVKSPTLANICQSMQIVKEVDSTPTGAASEETKDK